MMPPNVALFVTPSLSAFHLSVPSALFGRQVANQSLFSVQRCAETPGMQHSPEGFALDAPYGVEAFDHADLIVLPYWPDPDQRPSTKLSDALQRAHARGAQIAGLCLGAFVLGYAGLLERRKASTHWEYEALFQQHFPNATLDINALYTQQDGIVTSAGTAAAIDCCLHLIREYHGSAVANHIARRMVMPPYREGGQAQFIEYPLPRSTADERINGLLDYLRRTIGQPHDLNSVASRVSMSRRTLTRHFMHATGQSITQWLLQERLRLAQAHLEATALSIEQIAAAVGFNSAVTFRQHFKAHLGIAPADWRRRFQSASARRGA